MTSATKFSPKTPTVIIVMGVSGCGKSTMARAIADTLKINMYDADDFHPAINKQHMAEGKPLTDDMRQPWVEALRHHLQQQLLAGLSCTLAFSGLRRAHRERLRQTPGRVFFLHLSGGKSLIAERMNARQNHFMPTALLDSQFDSLEPTHDEADVFTLDICKPVAQLVDEALHLITLN